MLADKISKVTLMKALILGFLGILSFSLFAKNNLSDTEVKQQMINNSIASYPGKCPCPYNVTSNGSRCGRKTGGYHCH
jgi:hypothetical protein